MPNAKPRLIPNEKIVEAVRESLSMYKTLEYLGLPKSGGSHARIRQRIEELGLDTSHWTGQGWNKGERYRPIKRATPLEELLVEDGKNTNRGRIKRELVQRGIFDYLCALCGISEWQGQRLSLRLDHINGIRTDNRLENLRLLCPNCDSLTEFYCGRNKGAYVRT